MGTQPPPWAREKEKEKEGDGWKRQKRKGKYKKEKKKKRTKRCTDFEKNLFYIFIGFTWQGFGSRGLGREGCCRGGFCEKTSEASPVPLTELVSPCSKMDLKLTKAQPIGNVGTTFEITYLRKCKSAVQQQLGKGWDNDRETALQTQRSQKNEGEEVLQVPEQRFPCSLGRRRWWSRLSLCNPWTTPHHSRWMCPEGSCSPWRAHAGAGFWQDLWPVGNPWWSSSFLKYCTSMEVIHAGAVLQELQPVAKNHVREVCEGLCPVGGTQR